MTELREKKHKKQQDIATEIGIDHTAYNRYENGKTVNISRSLEKKLLKFFSEEEVKYIKLGVDISQKGDNNLHLYGDNNNIGNGSVKDCGEVYKLPADIETMVSILKSMNVKQRMEVLRYTLELCDL